MSDAEQQGEEIEVLMSIFPSEFAWIDEATMSFSIKLEPIPGGTKEENFIGILLHTTFPPGYPTSEAPELSIVVEKGLGKSQSVELKALADTTAADQGLGVPIIFTVCEALKEWMCDNNVAGQDGSMYAQMLKREQKKEVEQKKKEEKAAISAAADFEVTDHLVDPEEEERIRRRQAGKPVTLESFQAWKEAFEAEMLAASGAVEKAAAVSEVRLSGKQLFLQNRAGVEPEAAEGEDEGEDYVIPEKRSARGGGGGAGGGGGEEEDEDEDDEDYEEEDDEEDDEDDEDFEDDFADEADEEG